MMKTTYNKGIKKCEEKIETIQMELAGLQAQLDVVDKWKKRKFDPRFEHYEFPWAELNYQERAILQKMLKKNKRILELTAEIRRLKKKMAK